eukprot:TRINITY_DN4546_c0_g1_i1.p1 TRINITY_DN4546_c0_g1~~TRINITY_DN4546_c0_g1_i1.p1  ORF type:complete len:278 (+),score=67.15 TRINITY_DN4546_c0_g1_i1:121-954(+)
MVLPKGNFAGYQGYGMYYLPSITNQNEQNNQNDESMNDINNVNNMNMNTNDENDNSMVISPPPVSQEMLTKSTYFEPIPIARAMSFNFDSGLTSPQPQKFENFPKISQFPSWQDSFSNQSQNQQNQNQNYPSQQYNNENSTFFPQNNETIMNFDNPINSDNPAYNASIEECYLQNLLKANPHEFVCLDPSTLNTRYQQLQTVVRLKFAKFQAQRLLNAFQKRFPSLDNTKVESDYSSSSTPFSDRTIQSSLSHSSQVQNLDFVPINDELMDDSFMQM